MRPGPKQPSLFAGRTLKELRAIAAGLSQEAPPFATDDRPGSEEKIQVMCWRYSAGYDLYHPDDATLVSTPMKVWREKKSYGRYWRVVKSHHRYKALVAVKKNGVMKYRMIGSFASPEAAESAAMDHYQRYGVQVINATRPI